MREEQNFEKEVELRRIQVFILENVADHPNGLAAYVQYKYDVRRVHVYEALRRLVSERVLDVAGKTTRRTYSLRNPSMTNTLLAQLRQRVANEERLLVTWRTMRMKTLDSGRSQSRRKGNAD